MPLKTLPFSGYSWPFTQHSIAINPKTLYGFLTCASLSEGKKNPGREITDAMIRNKLLTPNVRDGRADAWRDYQQVLAELGLIYSTKVEKNLRLTLAGKMYLSGEIGFSELMTSQALRYQYPNGYKYDLQARLRQQVNTTRVKNLIDLYKNEGIYIKPATLIARVLIDFTERGQKGTLSIDECLAFLLPLKNNMEWKQAADDILTSRVSGASITVNRHARRNIQDWFKFLGMTDFFETTRREIYLSEYGKQSMEQLKRFCDAESAPSAFWKPKNSSKESRLDWFDYFGEIPFNLEVARPLDQINNEYEKKNYVAGLDQDMEDESAEFSNANLALGEITRSVSRIKNKTIGTKLDPDVALANLEMGIMRRYTKTLAHDEIIIELAQHFQKHGARVYEDPDSLDLLAVWPDGKETLFEVKTITRRSIQQRIRMAVGQLEEYAYRRAAAVGKMPDKVLTINIELPQDSWYLDFLNKHMGISVVTKTKKGYIKHLAQKCESSIHWSI